MRADDVRVAYPLFHTGSGGAKPTSALQLLIHEIPIDTAIALNKKWHSRLPEYRTGCRPRQHAWICFGAEYDGIFYATAIWSHPNNRFLDNEHTLELRRMAISPDRPKNTASRMLRIMVKIIRQQNPEFTRFISYQDTEVHAGTIYKASNWKSVAENNAMDYTFGGNRERPTQKYMARKIRWELNILKGE